MDFVHLSVCFVFFLILDVVILTQILVCAYETALWILKHPIGLLLSFSECKVKFGKLHSFFK